MPLLSLTGDQAFANLRGNRGSLWPDGRKDRARLNGVAQVACEPSFQFVAGESVFTTGSCFARNIEQRLEALGFDLPARRFTLPEEERASDTANDFLNKYPPHSILNEIRWALDPDYAYPDRALVKMGEDLWHDPHSAPNVKPASLERVMERRAMVDELYRLIPTCRVMVMTLGLMEAWFDERTGVYLNGAPASSSINKYPGRFRLDLLSVDEVVACLNEIHDLLERFGHPDFRILLTVSPVPFRSTFTGRDAITANSYSKSALRAAAEMFVLSHPRVNYFPSYEIVTHTPRASAYIQDNRHVTPQLVSSIVDKVVEAYMADGEQAEPDIFSAQRTPVEIAKAVKRGAYDRAAQLYASLDEKSRFQRAGFEEFDYRFEYGKVLLRCGQIAHAQAQIAAAVRLNPTSADAHHQLARALARLQRPLDAEIHFREAVTLAPDASEYRRALANSLKAMGDFAGAEEQLVAALKGQPDDAKSQEMLAEVQVAAATQARVGA